METADREVKTFLFAHMYRHPEVKRVRESADRIVRALYGAYVATPGLMPAEWAARAYGGEGVRFYTKLKTLTTRWPVEKPVGSDFIIPTMK